MFVGRLGRAKTAAPNLMAELWKENTDNMQAGEQPVKEISERIEEFITASRFS